MTASKTVPKVDTESLGDEFLDALALLELAHNAIGKDSIRREVGRFLEAHKTAAANLRAALPRLKEGL